MYAPRSLLEAISQMSCPASDFLCTATRPRAARPARPFARHQVAFPFLALPRGAHVNAAFDYQGSAGHANIHWKMQFPIKISSKWTFLGHQRRVGGGSEKWGYECGWERVLDLVPLGRTINWARGADVLSATNCRTTSQVVARWLINAANLPS